LVLPIYGLHSLQYNFSKQGSEDLIPLNVSSRETFMISPKIPK